MRKKYGLYSQIVKLSQPRKQGQLSGSYLGTQSPVVGGVLRQHDQGGKRMSPLLLTYTQIPAQTSVCTAHTYTHEHKGKRLGKLRGQTCTLCDILILHIPGVSTSWKLPPCQPSRGACDQNCHSYPSLRLLALQFYYCFMKL